MCFASNRKELEKIDGYKNKGGQKRDGQIV